MLKLVSSDKDSNREAWLQSRADYIGGSEIGTICGVNTYPPSAEELWWMKKGQLPAREYSPSMRMGDSLEKSILEVLFAEQHPELHVGHNRHSYSDDKYPLALATPDGLAIENGQTTAVVQIKYSNDRVKWKGPEIPLSEFYQVQWEMGVMGVDRGHLFVMLSGPNDFRDIPIAFNEELFKGLYEVAEAFVASQKDSAPPKSVLDPDLAVRTYYEDKSVDLADLAEVVAATRWNKIGREITELNKPINALEKERKELKKLLDAALGDAAIGVLPDGSTVWRKRIFKKASGESSYDRWYFKDAKQPEGETNE